MRLLALSTLVTLLGSVCADASSGGGLYPPGLLPLINRANALLSTGQFGEAVRIYSEAIEQSPADYLLYYKRATALLSLSRHSSALEDFDKVLSLTSNSFDNAHLMKARIYAKDGSFEHARDSLEIYLSRNTKSPDPSAVELSADIVEGEKLSKKAMQERQAQLWNACIETTSSTLRVASHSTKVRAMRVECALAAGDLDTAAADLTRLSHLLPPNPELLTRIFRLQYFLLGISEAQTHLTPIKQCLHRDPDSKQCLPLHRMAKGLDRGFAALEDLMQNGDWRGAIKLLTTSGKNNDLLARFEDALVANTHREHLLGPDSDASIPLPKVQHVSPRRAILVHALCKAYIQSNLPKKAESWCEELLRMEGREDDLDGLIGRGENLLIKEEYEEAVRVLEQAFEASGRGSREIHSRLQKAQKLLKQSKQKDYYKILGVSRDADDRTIKKAFRMGAKTAHPDKGGSEAKMAALNEAYEVLSDPELRRRFDMGDDPNDPSGGQGFGGSGHPFAHFFQQSGGGSQFFQQGGGGGGGGGSSFKFSYGGF